MNPQVRSCIGAQQVAQNRIDPKLLLARMWHAIDEGRSTAVPLHEQHGPKA